MSSLDRLVVVLSHPTEPANIGAAARAMKTMGLRRLRLIAPEDPLGEKSRALAHGALDVLESAEIHADLPSAVADARVVAGTTSRHRQLRKHALLSPAELGRRLLPLLQEGTVCLLFGTERTGLTNQELDVCRFLSTVQTATPQPSLNLSQAVMLYAWEMRKAVLEGQVRDVEPGPPAPGRPPEMRVRHPHRGTRLPTQAELEVLYGHVGAAMDALSYTDFERRKFTTYLRQLHMRAGIVDWEMQIYHILARRILQAAGRPVWRPAADVASAADGPRGGTAGEKPGGPRKSEPHQES